MFNKQIVIVLFSCCLFACAGGGQATEDGAASADSRRTNCIFRSSVRGYSVLDEANLIVEASGRRDYHVTLRRRAYGLRSTWSIGFESPTGSICARSSEVVFKGHLGGEKILIESIRELSPEERDDLLIRYGKKEPEIKQAPVPHEVGGADVEELDPDAADDPSGN